MKRLLLFTWLLLSSVFLCGQGLRYDSVANSTASFAGSSITVPLPGATVTVCSIPLISVSPTGATESGNVVTITTTAPHGLLAGQSVIIQDVGVAGYNGTFTIATAPGGAGSTTFTYINGTTGLGNSGGGFAIPNSKPCTNTATIYSDPGLLTSLANPLTADSQGNFGFWAPAGTYVYTVTGSGIAGAGPYFASLSGGAGGSNTLCKLNGAFLIDSANLCGWGGPDWGAWFNSAVSALGAAGGAIHFKAGVYAASSTVPAFNVPLVITGDGSGIALGARPTVLTLAAGVSGFNCQGAAAFSRISNLYLLSNSTVAGTDDGILAQCHAIHIENVVADGFGRKGVNTTASNASGQNANNWIYINVRTANGKGEGFYWSGTDVNQGTCINCDGAFNTGWSFNNTSSVNNVFIAPHVEGALAFQDAVQSNTYIGTYCESAGAFTLTVTSSHNDVKMTAFAPCTVTDLGASNTVKYVLIGVDGQDNFNLFPKPGATGPTVYGFASGTYNNSWLSISDLTNGRNILAYDPTGRILHFVSPVQPMIDGGASDPSGAAGVLYYRTDLNRHRFFDTAWHTTVGADTTEQLIHKTGVFADSGSACTNGELALSTGWQSTGTATVTAVAGTGQTCSWTITTGTTTAANPTITDTLTNALPSATTVCELNIHGGTHTFAAAGEYFNQTTLSATAPIFTANFTPTAGGTTYFVTRRCGP